MKLIDSNILIYSYSSSFEYLRKLILDDTSFISEISRVEVLGFYGLENEEENYFQDVFRYVPVIFPSQEVFDKAIEIRKKYKLKLGDSLIAATALIYQLEICTRNLSDFEKIDGLKCINPVVES